MMIEAASLPSRKAAGWENQIRQEDAMTTEMTRGLILIVDDDPINIELLIGILEDDYELLIATSGESAIEIAIENHPDLILLDVMMPGMNGYEVCDRLKQYPDTAGSLVIFITGLGEDDAQIRGLAAGAVDYVSKPINPAIVARRVANHIELKRARDRLTRLALLDGLTGLSNRRSFDRALDLECQRLRRASLGHLSLILLDIDYFKLFNDTYGHHAGDVCLKRVADAIMANIRRANDFAGRYGGEEFVCILPETSCESALRLAERIRTGILEMALPHAGSKTASIVTASFGVVTVEAGMDVAPGVLVAAADTLLYGAKNQGRNRVIAANFPNEFPRSFFDTQPTFPLPASRWTVAAGASGTSGP